MGGNLPPTLRLYIREKKRERVHSLIQISDKAKMAAAINKVSLF